MTLEDLPLSIQKLLKRAIKEVEPLQVIFFGSRVTKNFNSNSDFDLFFKIDPNKKNSWKKFIIDLEDNSETLLNIDLVSSLDCNQNVLNSIYKTGKLLYERSKE